MYAAVPDSWQLAKLTGQASYAFLSESMAASVLACLHHINILLKSVKASAVVHMQGNAGCEYLPVLACTARPPGYG